MIKKTVGLSRRYLIDQSFGRLTNAEGKEVAGEIFP